MSQIKPAEEWKMGTELCQVSTGEVKDRTTSLLPELAKSDIPALRKIQRSKRFLSKQGWKAETSIFHAMKYYIA